MAVSNAFIPAIVGSYRGPPSIERDHSMNPGSTHRTFFSKRKWHFISAGLCLTLLAQEVVLLNRFHREYQPERANSFIRNFVNTSSESLSHVSCNISSPQMEIVKKDVYPTNRNGRHIIFYHLHQTKFVKDLVDCILMNFKFAQNHNGKQCHLIYQHVQKTGGRAMENFLARLLQVSRAKACCLEEMRQRFYNDIPSFCTRIFQSYEVYDGFDAMVQTCQEVYQKNGTGNHKIMVLTTLREPVERSLSQINHFCNKNLNRRTPELQAACRACNHSSHLEVWNDFPHRANDEYQTVAKEALHSEQDRYFLDISDMDSMIQQLQEALPEEFLAKRKAAFEDFFQSKINPEIIRRCDFVMSSSMMKAYRPSKSLYKSFMLGTLGIDNKISWGV